MGNSNTNVTSNQFQSINPTRACCGTREKHQKAIEQMQKTDKPQTALEEVRKLRMSYETDKVSIRESISDLQSLMKNMNDHQKNEINIRQTQIAKDVKVKETPLSVVKEKKKTNRHSVFAKNIFENQSIRSFRERDQTTKASDNISSDNDSSDGKYLNLQEADVDDTVQLFMSLDNFNIENEEQDPMKSIALSSIHDQSFVEEQATGKDLLYCLEDYVVDCKNNKHQ